MNEGHGETLTFLMSDIEGSTHRWERDNAAMARALERHDELLRKVLERVGGRWVKHTGDGALVVFPSALAALAGAVEAQRALIAEDWSEVGGLRARMALHTGEVRQRDGDYFGQALNRTSRLLSLAHGGQVLLSLATEELVRGRLTHGLALLDLGSHRLADIDHVEHVFQIVADDLPSQFPPLRSLRATSPSLPGFRTSFVGRHADLDALEDLVTRQHLITLTGVGGSGKTRLAVELAQTVAEQFLDGVYFVDLAAITDEQLVARQTAQAIGVVTGGVVGPSGEPIAEQLVRAVAGKEMLLVLDNCEHLLDACADHAEALLGASAGIRILATSREALGLEGEQTWPVRSLELPDDTDTDTASMRLLLDRILELRPDFVVADDDRDDLIQICRRLDGLPLALELAAARLSHLSPGEVASRLDDRFRLLAGGRRRTERQQTLRAAIDWSHDLLEDSERVLLRRLSVFVGGAPLEAIEAIAMTGLDHELAVDLVGRLVARSLVVADTDGPRTRYRLLETIRLYAEEKLLDADEAETVRDRHRDWYLTWLERFDWDLRLFSPVVADQIQAEYDNLRLALEWSAAQAQPELVARFVCGLAGFGVLNGYADELDRWRSVAHEGGIDEVSAAELDAHGAYMDVWRYNGDPTSFGPIRERVQSAFEALPPDHAYRTLARCMFGATHTVTHPHEPWRIEEPAREALELARQHDAHWAQIMALGFLSRARLNAQDPQGAVEVIRAAMAIPAWAPEHDGHTLSHELAIALHLLGAQTEALEHALLVLAQGGRSWRHVGNLDASMIVAAQGDPEAGRDHIRKVLARLDEMRWHHPLAMSDCTVALGAIATYEARWEDAARLLAVSGSQVSHPALWAVFVHYRERIRKVLPKDVRDRCIEEGRALGVLEAIDAELAR